MNKYLIGISINDTIKILESAPAMADLVTEVNVVHMANRVSIAHLAIERGLKFLITEAGCEFEKVHDLRDLLEVLRECSQGDAEFLVEYFDAAVRFYGPNTNQKGLTHLKSLHRYLSQVGTEDAFQRIRYWELTPSLSEPLIGQIWLPIHTEIMYGLWELCRRAQEKPKWTIKHRVEAAAREALWPIGRLAYGPGTGLARIFDFAQKSCHLHKNLKPCP